MLNLVWSLQDVLTVIAAARREQARDIIAMVCRLQNTQYRFPPGSQAEWVFSHDILGVSLQN